MGCGSGKGTEQAALCVADGAAAPLWRGRPGGTGRARERQSAAAGSAGGERHRDHRLPGQLGAWFPGGSPEEPGAQQGRSALWQGVGGQASRSLMDHFAEILFALNKHCFSYLSVWIKEAMQQDGFPSARVSPEQKETFSQQILRLAVPHVRWE